MKYILRIVIVLAIIVGIVFGVRYCINQKPVNEQIQNNTMECVNIEKKANLDKIKFLEKLGTYKSVFENKGYSNIFNDMETINNLIDVYIGEIYLTNNSSKDSLKEIKNIKSQIESNFDEYDSKRERIVNVVSKQSSVNTESMENFSNGLIKTMKQCRFYYAKMGQFVMNYVKEFARNGITDSKFDNALDTIDNLVITFEGDM